MVPTDVRPATLTEPISVVTEPMNHTTGAEPNEPSVSRTGRGSFVGDRAGLAWANLRKARL